MSIERNLETERCELCSILNIPRSTFKVILPSARLDILLSVGLFVLLQLGCARFQDTNNGTVEANVQFRGIDEPEIVNEVRQAARFPTLEHFSGTKFLYQRRARQYVPKLTSILTSHGYYAADIEVGIRQDDKDNFEVMYNVQPGPLYNVTEVKLQIDDINPDDRASLERLKPEQLGIGNGVIATAKAIRSAADKLKALFRKQGFAFAEIAQPKVLVNHDQRTVRVVLRAEAGPLTRFGKTRIKGLKTVDETFVRSKLPWQPGGRYDPGKIRTLRQRLVETQLFSLVRVLRGTEEPVAELPILIEVTEVDHRLVSAGVGYETDRGFGVRASWEHRNLKGRGRRLRLSLNVSRTLYNIMTEYRRPRFLREDQSLRLQGSVSRDDTDAFESTSAKVSGHVDRQITPNLSISGGIAATGTHVAEEETEDFFLLSLPLNVEWDRRNDVLDPSEGWRLSAAYTPFKEVISGDLLFHKTVLSAHWYTEAAPSLVLALRSRVGTIWGEDAQDIPADERFYAGGGGSIRGYPFQDVGPGRINDPAGGRSLLEVSAELRWKWTDKIGSAVFLDGGNVYRRDFPDVDEDLFWGSGLGMRYYTPVGPLRLDLAFPLNKPVHVNERFQVYISLGQAF